jgi:hypothetical protein
MNALLVTTARPDTLDAALKTLGGIVRQHPDGTYAQIEPEVYAVHSVSGDLGFLRFAITQYGYGTVVGERELAAPAS